MQQLTEQAPLDDAISAYAAVSVTRDADGRAVISAKGEDHLANLCREIAQTRLPRRLRVFASGVHKLDLIVRNGRVMSLEYLHDGSDPLLFHAGSAEEAHSARAAIDVALAGCNGAAIETARVDASDTPEANGLDPASLLTAQSQTIAQAHTPAIPGLTLRAGKVTLSPDAGPKSVTLAGMLEDKDNGAASWVSALNEGLFDAITLASFSGDELHLDFAKGVINFSFSQSGDAENPD